MPRTPIRQDRERLLEEIKALRQRVRELENAQAAGSDATVPISTGGLPSATPHPQAYPLGDPAFPYQRMVEELSEGLVALSPTHAIRYVNRRFASLLGLAPERLLDADFFDLIAPEDQARFETFLNESAHPYVELHLSSADGRRVPVEISTRDWVVNGIRTFLVVIDLSDRQRMQATLAQTEAERRQIETSLKNSERYFERIFQLSPTAIVLSRLEDSLILDVNEKFLKLTGYAREQVIGQSAIALGLWVDPQERAGLKARLQDGQTVHHYEGHLQTQAGEVRDVLISADLIGRRGENVILALLDDITERKRLEELARRHTEQVRKHAADMQRYADEVRKHAEERQQHATLLERLVHERTAALDAERSRWQGVVEGIADEVWVCDPQGKISLINLPDVTAMGLREFTGKTIAEIYEEVDILTPDGQLRPLDQAPLLRSLKGEIVRGEEIMRHRQTGRTRYRQFSCAPTRDSTGAITGAVAIVRDVTEHKELQQAVEQASRRVHEILESIQDGFSALDRDWRFTYVNQRAAQNIGLAPEALVGRNLWETLPTLLGTTLEEQYRTAMTQRTPVRFESSGVSTGTIFEVRVYPSAEGLSVYWIDITERKRAETTLRKRETTLAQAGRMAQLGAWDVEFNNLEELDANPLTWSDEVYRIFGYAPGAVQATNELFFERVHPDDRQRIRETVAHARATRQPYSIEHRIVRPDGSERIVHEHAEFFFDERGQPIRLVGAVQDITERKHAEEARAQTLEELRLNEERFRTALKNAPITVYNMDLNLNYTWAFNPRGARSSDLRGKQVEQIIPKLGRELKGVKRGVIQSGIGTRQEVQAVGPDGQTHVYDLTVDPLRDENHNVVGITCAAIDITEHKQAARRIQELNQELEQRATQLEIANRELESFSYSVSHDLRTPLATIDGFAQVLHEDYGAQLPAQGQRYLDLIRGSTRQMEELIQSLLALARLSSHAVQKQTVNMTRLAMQAFESVHQEPMRQDLTFAVHDLPEAQADPVLLKQVWVNLIANALKFTRNRGNARIEIGCEPCDGEERVYYVRDNGVGFDMAQADRLFGVFQRLHGEEEYEGTGVGLAIVQRIVNRHGGRVWAEGEVGKGATFFFTLSDRESPA